MRVETRSMALEIEATAVGGKFRTNGCPVLLKLASRRRPVALKAVCLVHPDSGFSRDYPVDGDRAFACHTRTQRFALADSPWICMSAGLCGAYDANARSTCRPVGPAEPSVSFHHAGGGWYRLLKHVIDDVNERYIVRNEESWEAYCKRLRTTCCNRSRISRERGKRRNLR